MTRRSVVVLSGGMDSTVVAYLAAADGPVELVSFDYGQRHRTELSHAAATAARLHAPHHVVDLRSVTGLLAGRSALVTGDVAVPDGHYAEASMRATVVPNRNAIMFSVAAGIAVAHDADRVAVGVHAGDHFIYPDCRPEFVSALGEALLVGNDGFAVDGFHLWAPFVSLSKADIVRAGDRLGVPWRDTWSCYKGGDVHCGACGTCFERREAFTLAGVADPTVYDSTPEYEAP